MTAVTEVLQDLFGHLDALGIPYVIGGSFASSSWGHPRQTNDLDIAIRLRRDQAQPLVNTLSSGYMVSMNEVMDALDSTETYRSFQLLHFEKVFKIDVFVPLPSEFTDVEFEKSQKIEIVPGLVANCASPECIVIQKLRWFELGNRVSDRQWNDIVQVLEIQEGQLDVAFLDKWTQYFGLFDLLQSARTQVN